MKKKTLGFLTAGALVVGAAGGAYAYWTGTGSGSAATGTSTDWLVTVDSFTGTALTPGGPSQTVNAHIKNAAASGTQRLTGVSVAVKTSTGGAWSSVANCSAADYTVSIAPAAANGYSTSTDVAAGSTVDGVITISMNNLDANQDGCKN